MTNEAYDTNLLVFFFLILRSRESLTDKIWHMNLLAPTSKRLHFQFVKFILIGHFFHVLLTNEHSLTSNQNYCLAFFFETYIKVAI